MNIWRLGVVIVVVTASLLFLFYSLYTRATNNQSLNNAETIADWQGLPDTISACSDDSLFSESAFLASLREGLGQMRKGKPDSAVLFLNMAAAIKPSAALVYCRLCQAHIELRNFDSAIASCRKAIKLKPDYSAAIYFETMAQKRKSGISDWH